eukprot:scaffold77057_cov33-Prasinocladus_malaysianus.AAC.1
MSCIKHNSFIWAFQQRLHKNQFGANVIAVSVGQPHGTRAPTHALSSMPSSGTVQRLTKSGRTSKDRPVRSIPLVQLTLYEAVRVMRQVRTTAFLKKF